MSKLMSTLANLFLKNAAYQSETTQFIQEFKRTHPQLDAQQRAGRALLWDKVIDREHSRDFAQSRVKQNAYVYATRAD